MASEQESFVAICERLVTEPGVDLHRAFSSPALRIHGKIFAMLPGEDLVVKLAAERCEAIVARGAGKPFESGRRQMREWVAVAPAYAGDWAALAEEALAFVDPSGDFRTEVEIAAAPTAVFDALMTPAGPGGWWSTDGTVDARAGGSIRLNWSRTDFIDFRIERLDRPGAVDWVCTAQHDANLPEPDEWLGTALCFRLREHGTGTLLRLVHRGLEPKLDCYDMCARGWDAFLHASLRLLAESGEASPWEASAA
jgi:uncharacterized protein YndB with AHSA1/START domain